MASSSSSNNNSSTPTKLNNSYFFYGTHPLPVPNSASAHNISSNAHYSSLNVADNHHGFSSISDLPTTRSLDSIAQSRTNDNETNDIFEDAVETFDNDHVNGDQNSEEQPTMTLVEALTECLDINQLFFQNQLNEALAKARAQENRSLYHSLCLSTITYMQAAMTFDHDDIETTIQSIRNTTRLAKKHETYKPWIPFNFYGKTVMNEHELHAKLVYAEALLLRAILTFVQDQGLLSFINGALKIKECHDIFVKLAKQNDPSRFSSSLSHEHFDSGVRMGNGAFNLMISNLPQRVIRYLAFAGFSGDREFGLRELEKSAFSSGLRSTFSALFLLCYHAFVTPVFGNCDGNLELCNVLVERYLKLYPNSYLFLFFQARLCTLHCQLHQGISTYKYAMQCQKDWKHLHHIAYWEILWCHALEREWKDAAYIAKTLLNENNWSKAMYCYLLSTFLFEENNRTATEEVMKLYKRVPELKIRLAGKSNPLEKYAIRQCERFSVQRWLFLPALELTYLMNGFYILAHDKNKLNSTLDIVNNALTDLERHHQNDRYYLDSYGSGLLLRGVLLQFLQRYDEALDALNEIIQMAKKFDTKSFLAANAQYEKGLIYLTLKQKAKAVEHLQKSLNDYKDYQLESRLQFRINAAMQTAKRMNN